MLTLSPHLKMLLIDNLSEFRFMMSSIADGALISNLIENRGESNFFSKITLNQLTFFLQISIFKSPGTIVILIGLLIFSCINLIRSEEEKSFHNLKKLCQIWIIVNIFLLAVNDQVHLDRRTVGLFIPFFLYFIILIENKSLYKTSYKINNLKKFILLILISIVISYYISGMFGVAGRNYLNFEKYIFFLETSNKVRFLIILPIVIPINYILFLFNANKLKKSFLIIFFLINSILNFFSYFLPGHTIRDASNILTEKIKPLKPKFIYGPDSYSFSLENNLIPLWNFNSQHSYSFSLENNLIPLWNFNPQLNAKLIEEFKKKGVIHISSKEINSNMKLLYVDNIIFNKITNKYQNKIYYYYNK